MLLLLSITKYNEAIFLVLRQYIDKMISDNDELCGGVYSVRCHLKQAISKAYLLVKIPIAIYTSIKAKDIKMNL